MNGSKKDNAAYLKREMEELSSRIWVGVVTLHPHFHLCSSCSNQGTTQSINHEGVPMEKSGMEDADEELVCVGEQVSNICPILQSELVEPVKNPDCSHVYSKAGIEQLLATKDRVECPGSY